LFWEAYEALKSPCGQNGDLFHVKAGEIYRMKRNSSQVLHRAFPYVKISGKYY